MVGLVNKFKVFRWYHWFSLVLILLYISYIAASYFYLPGKLKQLVEEDGSSLIGRAIQVESIEFDPFDVSLRINGFDIAGEGERPLLVWSQLFIDVSVWQSLITQRVSLENIALTKPQLNLVKQGDRFNFTAIAEKLAADSARDVNEDLEADEGFKLALVIDKSAISHGVFHFNDLSSESSASASLDDINIILNDLYLATGDEHLNPFDVEASFPDGGRLKVGGQYRFDPLRVETELKATDIQLATFKSFISNIVPVSLNNGLLSIESNVLVTQEEGNVDVNIEQGHIALQALAIDDAVTKPALIRVENIEVAGIKLGLLAQQLSVDNVTVSGANINQWLDKDGKLRHEPLLSKQPAEVEAEAVTDDDSNNAPVEASKEWQWVITDVVLNDSNIYVVDKQTAEHKTHSLNNIAVSMSNISLKAGEKVTTTVNALLDNKAALKLDGEMVLQPFTMDMHYSLADYPLPTLSSYIEKASYLTIEKGALNVEGDVQLTSAEDAAFMLTAAIELEQFQADDVRTGQSTIEFDSFVVKKLAVDSAKQRITIAGLHLTEPKLAVELSPEGELNLATLTKNEPGESQAEAETQPTSSNWQFRVDAITMKNGTALFTDRTVSPAFKTGIYTMDFALTEFGSGRTDDSTFTFSSQIDNYAPLTITGSLAPIEQQPALSFKTELQGLAMPSLSAYSGLYIGNKLKSGQLSLDLDYTLKEGKLKGNNNVIAKDLYLGEAVASEQAVDAPVALGLALLRDFNGVVDLDIGVSGKLDDPGFSVGGIISKAFANILIKAVASPFSLLASLVGGEGEDMGSIEFNAGLASLNVENKKRLKLLVKALNQKPELVVEIVGNASLSADQLALQNVKLQQSVASERGISLQALLAESSEQKWWLQSANKRVIIALNTQLNLLSMDERKQALLTATPELAKDKLEVNAYQAVYDDLSSRQSVGESDVLALAKQRAAAIKQHLITELQFDDKRVVVKKTVAKQLTGRVTVLAVDTK